MLENYIALRESLGYEVRYSSTPLKQFVAYVERQGASAISTRLALRWVQRQRPGAARRKYSMIRVFAKYASAIDPRTVVPQAAFSEPSTVFAHTYLRMKRSRVFWMKPRDEAGKHRVEHTIAFLAFLQPLACVEAKL